LLSFGMAQISALRCPACGVESPAEMPDDACLFFWECPACHTIVRPKAGDCCVFCSYGREPCPPKLADLRREPPPPHTHKPA
jgi:hypothetical protein